jgi:hypothetical protein
MVSYLLRRVGLPGVSPTYKPLFNIKKYRLPVGWAEQREAAHSIGFKMANSLQNWTHF